MTDEKRISEEALRLLMESLGGAIVSQEADVRGVLAILISETIRFRDKLKEETGTVLTVNDTRQALGALEAFVSGQEMPSGLTSEQKLLAQIWIDRLTTFKR